MIGNNQEEKDTDDVYVVRTYPYHPCKNYPEEDIQLEEN